MPGLLRGEPSLATRKPGRGEPRSRRRRVTWARRLAMLQLAEPAGCRWQRLAAYFDERRERCADACDVCAAATAGRLPRRAHPARRLAGRWLTQVWVSSNFRLPISRWQTGRPLHTFLRLRLERLLGFSSAADYVRERLGLSPRTARALVAIERTTWEAPAFGAAYEGGALSWARALVLLPVLRERSEAAWTARAREVTLRRLVAEVEWSLDRWDADPTLGAPPEPPPPGQDLTGEAERQMRAPTDWTRSMRRSHLRARPRWWRYWSCPSQRFSGPGISAGPGSSGCSPP